jgi:DNA helicase HerA-like ATPase
VPVFLADVKGDLSGLGAAGAGSAKLDARLAQLGIPAPAFAASPTLFWDLFAEQGHPVRATVSDMGPCCSPACSASTTPRAGCWSWCSRWRTTRGCCCSI